MDPMEGIRVLVADSQTLFAQAISMVLERFPRLWVVQELATSGPDAVSAVERFDPDVAVVDYWMQGMDGPSVTRCIRSRAPQCKVILLSWYHGDEQIHYALEAGAAGLLPKSITVEELVQAIQKAHSGEVPVLPEQTSRFVKTLSERGKEVLELSERFQQLTPRENQILQLLATGLSREQVAEKIFISPTTVKVHIRHILAKTRMKTHGDAVVMAIRCGWIQP